MADEAKQEQQLEQGDNQRAGTNDAAASADLMQTTSGLKEMKAFEATEGGPKEGEQKEMGATLGSKNQEPSKKLGDGSELGDQNGEPFPQSGAPKQDHT